jgi:hypothetical protein
MKIKIAAWLACLCMFATSGAVFAQTEALLDADKQAQSTFALEAPKQTVTTTEKRTTYSAPTREYFAEGINNFLSRFHNFMTQELHDITTSTIESLTNFRQWLAVNIEQMQVELAASLEKLKVAVKPANQEKDNVQ